MSPPITIQTDDFDVGAEVAALHAAEDARADVGAVVSFVGTVRAGRGEAVIDELVLEHYPGMTERAIAAMLDQARARFDLRGARIIHRVGPLRPGERIVLVAVSAPHRHAAFQGAEFLMDYLKTQAPFWKLERGPQGARWVDAREADDAALARWGLNLSNAAPGPVAAEPSGPATSVPEPE